MAEPSSDDRIARLVHLVLEAVDQRLTEIRTEMHQLGQRLTDVERRVAEAPRPATQSATASAAPSSATPATTAPVADPRIDRLAAEVRLIREEVEALAVRPTPRAPARPANENANEPAVAIAAPTPSLPSLTTLTAQAPVAPALASPSQPAAASQAGDSNELIDLDRLGDLLSERLGQLHLPGPT